MKQTDKNKIVSSFQQLLDEQAAKAAHSRAVTERLIDASETYLPAYEPNVDAGFARLQERIATEQSTTKVVQLRPHRRWWSIAATVALVIGSLAAFQLFFNPSQTDFTTATTTSNELQTIELADGTTVRLNENSTLSYPTTFTGDTRTVQLNGEAFFDVTKNVSQPFIIETEATTVRVLGTSFSVRAKKNETVTKVVVQTGKVEVIDATTERKVTLQPYEQAIHQHGATIQKVEDKDLKNLAWHTLDFRKVAVSEVINTIENHYQIKINTQQATVLDCLQTINFAEADLSTTFAILQTSLDIEIVQIAENQYTIRGGNCAVAQ